MVDPAIADRVVRAGRVIPRIGTVWRIHEAIWEPDDPGGSLVSSGRWNCGRDLVPLADAFPVLYTATSPDVADWELIRHSKLADANAMWQRFVRVRRSWMDIAVPAALDLRDPSAVGLSRSDLLDDGIDAHALPQAIAAAAYARGLSGILAPSASAMGIASGDYNVMVFFDLTGATKTVYGFSVPETAPRAGVRVTVMGSGAPNLGAS